MSSSTLPRPPAVGTLIDNGTLELVSVLGYGGYGVVYRAIDLRSAVHDAPSYAVKCLLHTPTRNTVRQRRLHVQEITLHKRASAHPNVVTLHRVIEEDDCTFIVMDYCPDGDLFGQILHKRRYLGQDDLIKHAFLQLLDAVDYCHSLGIYHRDLKPENVLCFNAGLRLAITDFGLATTEKVSEEFRTGSVYHMSPGTSASFLCISSRRTKATLKNVKAEASPPVGRTHRRSMTYGRLALFFSTSLLGATRGNRLRPRIQRSKRTCKIP
jgi:serine/threonine protein kinase